VKTASLSLNTLRGRLAQILQLEELPEVDWDRVATQSEALLRELGPYAPLIVRAYLHDVQMRRDDAEFASGQRAKIAAYLHSSETKQNR
jgi:hypothetical protein